MALSILSSAFLSPKSVFFSRSEAARRATSFGSPSRRASFAATCSYSCTLSRNWGRTPPSSTADAVERRLGDVDVAAVDQRAHVAEEKGEQQSADVAAVHVGVGHENDFVIAELGGDEIILTDAGAERGDDGADFFVPQHLVVARLFDVEDLAFERKDGLG